MFKNFLINFTCVFAIIVVVVVFLLPVRLNYVHSSIVSKISFPRTNKKANLQLTVKTADFKGGVKETLVVINKRFRHERVNGV